MSKIKIYAAEAELSPLFENKTIAYCADIIDKPNQEILDRIKKSVAKASIGDKELFYHTSILVTTTWNKNDDIFTPPVVWAARNTPVDKPTNLEHDATKIVGHITGSWAIDDEGNIIEDTKDIVSLPSKFHILVGSVIYKFWDNNEEYETRATKLLEEIAAGTKYVSMECRFGDFDYMLKNDKEMRVIARNEDTAFLSKYLRAFGGTGEFNNYSIGRIVKDISFCGKGYVDKPANPESIIFSQDDIFDFAKAKICEKNDVLKIVGVSHNNTVKNEMEKHIMSDFLTEQNQELKTKNETLEKQVAELKEQFAKSNVSKLEKDIESLKAQAESLGGDLKSKSEELSVKETETKSLQAKVDELTKSNEDLAKSNEELNTKIAKIEAEQKTQSRISMLVDAGISREDAEKDVTTFASLDDTQFEAVANRIIEAAKMMDEKKKKEMKDNTAKCSEETKVDETTVDSAKIVDDEVISASADTNINDEVHNSLVKNLTAALKTSDKEHGDK